MASSKRWNEWGWAEWKEWLFTTSVRAFMIFTTVLALFGLGALVFFMVEQGMLEFGFTSLPLIYTCSGLGALFVFLAHVATWGKSAIALADSISSKADNANGDKIKYTLGQKIARVCLIVIALLGTIVYSASSFLGFLSMANALSATGAFLSGIKIFGIACSVSMFISGGAFNVYSMLKEIDGYFKKQHDREIAKHNRVKIHSKSFLERIKSYTQIKHRYHLTANITSSILAVGNGLGDVLFKAFGFAHFMVLIGLGAITASGVITFSPLGLGFMIVGAVTTFILSLATEGISMVSRGKEICDQRLKKVKQEQYPELILKGAAEEPQKKKSPLGDFLGKSLAFFVSFLQAIPTFTSSISKVAGLGAVLCWLLPGMQGFAMGLSITMGVFFFVSKFIGYFSQSGPFIVDGVASKADDVTQDVQDTYDKLEQQFKKTSANEPWYETYYMNEKDFHHERKRQLREHRRDRHSARKHSHHKHHHQGNELNAVSSQSDNGLDRDAVNRLTLEAAVRHELPVVTDIPIKSAY